MHAPVAVKREFLDPDKLGQYDNDAMAMAAVMLYTEIDNRQCFQTAHLLNVSVSMEMVVTEDSM